MNNNCKSKSIIQCNQHKGINKYYSMQSTRRHSMQFYRVYTSTLLIFMVKLHAAFWLFPQLDVYSLFIERAKPCPFCLGKLPGKSFLPW